MSNLAYMPAFPILDDGRPVRFYIDDIDDCLDHERFCTGMTKREMIAMHCAAALFSNASYKGMPWVVAERAVAQADALLDELKKYGE